MMNDDRVTGPVATALEPPPRQLLDRPIPYILADHARQRSVCAILRDLADKGTVTPPVAASLVAYLANDFELHRQDEEESLFPALRRRALPQDDLGPVLARLEEEHAETAPLVDVIVATLGRTPKDDVIVLTDTTRDVMKTFAAAEQHHLAAENAIVMVLAQRRLQQPDLKAISAAMKARREGRH